MDLSIIIVNWNTCQLLQKCLESVYKYPPSIEFEILVVDNASKDNSVEMVEETFPKDKYPSLRLFANKNNGGFAQGNNQAIRESVGKFVLLLNPDTEVKLDALNELVRFLDEHPEAGGAGSMLLNPDQSLQPSCHPLPTLFREFWRLFHLDWIYSLGDYNMYRWDLETPRRIDVAQGASLMVRREVIEQIGLLDEDYFMYTEEVDYCLRMKKAGWLLYWVPQSKVIHYGGQSTMQIAHKMFLKLYETRLHYFRKNHGPVAGLIYKLILMFASLARVILSPLVRTFQTQQSERLSLLSGYYRDLLLELPKM